VPSIDLASALEALPVAPLPLTSETYPATMAALVEGAPPAPLQGDVRPTFGRGSTRDEVVAAQGAPTYRTKNSLWGGSSRVDFTNDGLVIGWVNGMPALNVRPSSD
jgi:hypothetical protein